MNATRHTASAYSTSAGYSYRAAGALQLRSGVPPRGSAPVLPPARGVACGVLLSVAQAGVIQSLVGTLRRAKPRALPGWTEGASIGQRAGVSALTLCRNQCNAALLNELNGQGFAWIHSNGAANFIRCAWFCTI